MTPARRPIRRLAPETIERIAAGEVVERPASVVKELVENAIDAGASSVTVRLSGGGLDRIEVSDDGSGIPAEELPIALERHATSKLDPTGPIEGIASLGFRGEALAAIASVSRLRLVSRVPDAGHATGIEVAAGARGPPFETGRSVGTTVDVRDLFFNTPARRKFLKAPGAEQVEVLRTIERLYLAQPRVGLRALAEEREIAQYPAEASLVEAAARVLGADLRQAYSAVEAEVPGGRVVGVLGRPTLAAPTSRRLFLAINGRAVESRSLTQEVRLAYGEFLPRTRFPVGVLHLEIDPDRLDVNVHPTKRTVRVAREREVGEALRRAARSALLAAPRVAEPEDGSPAAVPIESADVFRSARSAEGYASRVGPGGAQRTLEGPLSALGPSQVAARPGHPPVRLLACLDDLYWLASSGEDLLLIDQHAASERLVFEELRREGAGAVQGLVDPIVVHLSAAQRATLEGNQETIRRAGFGVEPFGPEAVRLLTVPSFRGKRVRPAMLPELLDELAEGGRPTVPDGLHERTAATIACHAAIRGGEEVSTADFAKVLDALYALRGAAYACPHGRPIAVRVPRARLDRWFQRSGP